MKDKWVLESSIKFNRQHHALKLDELKPNILEGAHSVAQLCEHLQRLKRRAAAMREQFDAVERGYFTPSEDDAVRHLLVSYWQARAALFDIILSLQDEAKRAVDEAGQQAFLVAYAAIVLLVDAARWLAEQFDGQSVIVAKLNEAEPHFEIPANTYDTVQQSLTSPIHAWHLYHANRYSHRHRRALRHVAQRHEVLGPVVNTIHQLGHRARMRKWNYLLMRLKVRRRQVSHLVAQSAVGRLIYAVEELGGRLVSDRHIRLDHQPALPPLIESRLRTLLRPGDVIITRREHALTNYFMPGFWPHAALFLGDAQTLTNMGIAHQTHVATRWKQIKVNADPEARCVIEAKKDGVRIRSLQSSLDCDAVAVVRPNLAAPQIKDSLVRALFHEGKPYDFDFDFSRSDRMVCTEVVYRAYEGVGGVRFDLTRRAGRLTFAAEDLLKLALQDGPFHLIATYVETHDLVTGEPARQLMARTLKPS